MVDGLNAFVSLHSIIYFTLRTYWNGASYISFLSLYEIYLNDELSSYKRLTTIFGSQCRMSWVYFNICLN